MDEKISEEEMKEYLGRLQVEGRAGVAKENEELRKKLSECWVKTAST